MVIATVKATLGAMAAAMVVVPSAYAGTAIYVDGTGNSTPNESLAKYVPPGYAIQRVDYPAEAAPLYGKQTAGHSIAAGVPVLDAMISAAVAAQNGPVVVVGVSLGAMVVMDELRNLAGRPDAPSPSEVSFVLMAAPTAPGGFLSYLPYTYSPVVDMVMQPFPQTPYNVSVIRELFDGISSFPDRPWNFIAVLNALAGGLGVYHNGDHLSQDLELVLNGRFPLEDTTVEVNSLGGVTSTYTSHASGLSIPHLIEAFLPGLAKFANTFITPIITPIVMLGYSSHTPDGGPHLMPGGTLVGKDGQPFYRPRDVERVTADPRARHVPLGAQSARPARSVGFPKGVASSAELADSAGPATERMESLRVNRGALEAARGQRSRESNGEDLRAEQSGSRPTPRQPS